MTSSALPALGVRLPNSGPFAEPEAVLGVAARSEALGYDRVWVHDHISWPQEKLTHFATGSVEACRDQDPNFFESIGTSAFLLGRLPRIGVGIAGLVLPLRDPRVLGKQLATLDRLAESRLVAAIGVGAISGDFEVMGVPFKRRGRITNDHLAALRAMFGETQPVDFASDAVTFEAGTFLPRPRGLRLWATGSSDAGLDRVVAMADGWLTVYQPVEAYRAFIEQIAAKAGAAGRDPASIETGYETYVCVGATHDQAIATARASLDAKFGSLERGLEVCIVGDAAEALDRIAAYGAAGAGNVELKFIGHDLDQVVEQVERVAEAAGLSAAAAVT